MLEEEQKAMHDMQLTTKIKKADPDYTKAVYHVRDHVSQQGAEHKQVIPLVYACVAIARC